MTTEAECIALATQRDYYKQACEKLQAEIEALKSERDSLMSEVARLKRVLVNVHNNGADWSGQRMISEAMKETP